MSVNGPAAVELVELALEAAGVGPDVGPRFLYAVTGVAGNVLEEVYPREEGIDLLAADHDLARPFVTKALDVAVEALTATEE